jgi:hypothetical protein
LCLVFRKNFKEEIQRITIKRNMSKAASRATRNSKVLSATSLQEIIDRAPINRKGSIAAPRTGPGNPKHGAMPPISRAFSIRPSSMNLTGMDDNLEALDEELLAKKLAPSDVSSKSESLSRSFKMSLRMKTGRRRTSSNPDVMVDAMPTSPGQRPAKGIVKTSSVSSPSLLSDPPSSSKSQKKRAWTFTKPRHNT